MCCIDGFMRTWAKRKTGKSGILRALRRYFSETNKKTPRPRSPQRWGFRSSQIARLRPTGANPPKTLPAHIWGVKQFSPGATSWDTVRNKAAVVVNARNGDYRRRNFIAAWSVRWYYFIIRSARTTQPHWCSSLPSVATHAHSQIPIYESADVGDDSDPCGRELAADGVYLCGRNAQVLLPATSAGKPYRTLRLL